MIVNEVNTLLADSGISGKPDIAISSPSAEQKAQGSEQLISSTELSPSPQQAFAFSFILLVVMCCHEPSDTSITQSTDYSIHDPLRKSLIIAKNHLLVSGNISESLRFCLKLEGH